MFALRACRPSLFVATTRSFVAANSSLAGPSKSSGFPASKTDSAPVDSDPPRAGMDGYPPPTAAPDPFDKRSISTFLTSKPKYRLHCKSTRNNTITTFTNEKGETRAWFSGGSCGFKKVNRSSYEAGYQCAVRMFKRIEEIAATQPLQVDLFFKGFGQGRDALHRALMTTEGESVRPLVSSITDRTAIKIGGTRAKKARRL
ncbi:mitochondrial ribosomal protein subunit S18 [Collybia nuda]|uniref:Mitochondrial ribosomal protein subunit S18 n=1 Tax=Collybia nuda TaxID=64659 RepID=A0A9P5YHE8_9AGAR|nr:mitochondrial ribosomal protein subunit S18 [Collybia nuda]